MKNASCPHTTLQLTPSPFAELAGYSQPSIDKRAGAERKSGRASKEDVKNFEEKRSISIFPGPLVLPHDDLNYDPECPPQSVKSWAQEKERNKMNLKDGRTTLYIAHVPKIRKEVDFMQSWTRPNIAGSEDNTPMAADAEVFADYLRAFYHGMNVRVLPIQLSWTTWGNQKPASSKKQAATLPKYIGLATDNDRCTRIRVRPCPGSTFTAQLNLDDILDAAIEMLPADAYAMCLLTNHDIYETDDDDFCCGRAYGGSRVAVVQSARYNPSLDTREKIDRTHMWPMSHCKTFIDGLCAVEDVAATPPTELQRESSLAGPMRAAVDTAALHTRSSSLQQELQALWFSRLARTVSHELGHCFGTDHCTYYACNMQGTAGMKEDVRQPPYLCAVCEAKVGYAIVGELQSGGDKEREAWVRQRCEALRVFCARLENVNIQSAMWRGLDAWLGERMEGL